MTLARRAVALFVVLSLSFVSRFAAASNDGAELVAIITSEPNASLTRRVRAELVGLGVDVIVLKPPAESSTLRAPLEQTARNVGAIAAVRLVPSREGKIEVWVVDRVTGKTVVRELDASGTGASDASVAVGTVELLRASLMELHASEPPHGEVAPTPKVEALALPSSPPIPYPRFALAVGGGAELGIRGLGPSADAQIGIWVRLGARVGLRAIGELTLVPSHVTTAEGAVDVRSQFFGAALSYDFADPAAQWVPQLSLGLAASHVMTSGTAVAPFTSASADAWFAAPFADLGIGWAFVRGMRLRADGLVAWALPSAHVEAADEEVGQWGAPAAMLTLGLEVLWSP